MTRILLRVAVWLVCSGAALAHAEAPQPFDEWMSPWGPGRKSSGEHFHSAAEPLGAAPFRLVGKDWSLAFGGQFFARTESRDNRDFDAALADRNTFIDQRARLTARASYAGRFGIVLEFQDVRAFGSEPSTTVTAPFTGLHQGFVDLHPTSWFHLRLGRQELAYGEERLIGNLDWGQAARAFDGLFLRFAHGTVTLDAFAMLARDQTTLLDGSGRALSNDGVQFYGLYGRWRPRKKFGLDLYALGLVEDPTSPALGQRGSRGLATFGLRTYAHLGPVSLNFEGAAQVGSSLEGELRAFGLVLQAQYTFPLWGKPYVLAKYRYASGDADPRDGRSGTFNQLFPTGHGNLGFIDYAAWSNVIAYRATAGWRPFGVHIWVDAYRYEKAEAADTWYDAGGRTFIEAERARGRLVMGTEVDVSVSAPLSRLLWLAAGWAAFVPGAAAERPASGRGADTSHWGFLYLRSQF